MLRCILAQTRVLASPLFVQHFTRLSKPLALAVYPGLMAGSADTSSALPRLSIVELSSDDLVEVEDHRASIIAAAAGAQNIAMLTGTHGVVSPPLSSPHGRLPAASDLHP